MFVSVAISSSKEFICDMQESIVYPTVAATPKLIRKRKAEDETLPFSM
jgi:hypothetical protein